MRNRSLFLATLLLIGNVHAQQQSSGSTSGTCPKLSENSGLSWVHKAMGPSDLCRAMRADGSEAFGLHIAGESSFKPKRGDREEKVNIDGQAVWWYSSELATQPKMRMRETLLEFSDGRVAHIWVQAMTDEDLAATLNQANQLHFQPGQLVGSR